MESTEEAALPLDAEKGTSKSDDEQEAPAALLDDVVVEKEQTDDSDDEEDDEEGRVHRYRTRHGLMPRQWLIDRCDGTSKYNPESRPPCRICWVPPPVKMFPNLLEQNCLCEKVGKIGCTHAENTRARKILFMIAFLMNWVGLFLLIVSLFSISVTHFSMLWRVSFTNVWLELVEGPERYRDTPTFYELGLRAAAFQSVLMKDGERGIVPFDHFCDAVEAYINSNNRGLHETDVAATQTATWRTFTSSYRETYDCNACEDISRKIVPTLFLSMLSYIPNFTTDVLRMYSNYDVNCQKFMAIIFQWVSLATSIYTWVNYRRGCFDSLNTDPFPLDSNFERVSWDSDDIHVVVEFHWRAGVGQVCLAVATLLKVVDIIFNCVLPTPTITRDFEEQVDYEWNYGNREQYFGTEDDGALEEGVQSSKGESTKTSGTMSSSTTTSPIKARSMRRRPKMARAPWAKSAVSKETT